MQRRGLTLTEILLATMIMAFAMLPTLGILGRGHLGTKQDFRRIEAIHFAETTMNEALKLPYRQLPVGNHTSTLTSASGSVPLGSLVSAQGYTFDAALSVTNFPVTFSYQPVDLNRADFDFNNPALWQFLASTSTSGVFDGGGPKRPILMKHLRVTVSWAEPNGARPVPLEVISWKADLDQ